ncbi:uncharacterized protein EI97DRAFT_458146 [Westerdykella ornata]|uniref:Uncharacterized protein n=1 Tax=Westerdykella ornata TaxID=318751 RepID=A0A6A6JKM9_WESOR|nr:uncharacterized protein EI97DRAFT_458146 [Westerdykella ornata]KAF2276814.1 hypothetical protein EI97DRAFT_458146 [Westerdykella ornata]
MSLDLSNPGRTIQAGVILMGQTEILDVAPIDFLHGISRRFITALPVPDEIKAKALDIDFHWVTEKGGPAKLTSNITMEATDSYDSCPRLDIVLMGAYFPGYTPSDADLGFIRKAADECAAFISICGGIVPAALAGVLKNKTCTGPRELIPQFPAMLDPSINWVEKRWTRDRKVWTSGALLNGLDLMREFTKAYWPELAEAVIPLGGMPVRSADYEY